MIAVFLLVVVSAAVLIITKWLAVAVVIVIWSAARAVRLARREPDWYGGKGVAVATLVVTIAAAAASAGYAIANIPQFLENRRMRQVAATEAAMYHAAILLEDYKRASGAYPKNIQEIRKAISESLPTDYWNKTIKYQRNAEALADKSLGQTGIPFNNFELRSAGPDGKEGTDDDIIMRDGIFLTSAEIKKQSAVKIR